ncbi:MAG: ABC transporter ATP-binding protein [Desulfobacterales bacterium]|nr:ABC transporter ATP-binding protein [Desulfobacterales bacterium]
MTIVLENVTKVVRGEDHIYKTSITLEDGSFNVLLGATLSGKTSLIRLIAGLDHPTKGRILVNGKNAGKIALQHRNIGMVYQEFINYPAMTVYENIASPLRMKRVNKVQLDKKVRQTAELLHLESFLNRPPDELSGGQQQRLAMARALVKDSDLLILDEPLINLDYKLRAEIREELRTIIGQRNMIVVYATTEPIEALILGGETHVLHEGRILQSGPSLDIFNYPATVDVARNINNPPMNILDAQISGVGKYRRAVLTDGTQIHLNGNLSDVKEGHVKLGFRASQISFHKTSDTDIPIKGEVELAEVGGSETFVHLLHNGNPIILHEKGAHPRHQGDMIDFFVKPENLLAFDRNEQLISAPRI